MQKEKIADLQIQLAKLKVLREIDQDYQQNVISSIDHKIDNFLETRTSGVAVRSAKQSSSCEAVVLVLSGILGLMGVVLLSFFVKLVSAARQRMTAYYEWRVQLQLSPM